VKRLQDKVALITGSTQGIGRATAIAMAREGAHVVVNGRPPDSATDGSAADDAAVEIRALGRQVLVCHADVGNRDQVVKMFDQAVSHFGHIDIVVANAAFNIKKRVVDTEWDEVQSIMDVVMFGVFHTCQLAAQQMIKQNEEDRKGGKILINGSVHADIPVAYHAVYSMGKAAGKQLCRVLAVELAPYGINVNSVNPGWIDTPNERNFISEEEIQAAAKTLPWKRLGTVDEIAAAFIYLASPAADYITGHTLVVDGGLELDWGMLTNGLRRE